MKTVTAPSEVRTPAGETDAPSSSATTRRRAAPPASRTQAGSGTAKGRATTATRPARAPERRATRPARTPAAAPPKAPFVLLVVGLLGGALVSLLLLNTVLAQDAFTLSELQRGNQRLNERRQALQEDIARESSPQVLHAKARGLGMRDSDRPAFIDPRTGRVTEGGTRPPGIPDDALAAAAAGGVTGAPGALMPPAAEPAPRTRPGTDHAGDGTR
jgi:hypothetical protein